MHSMQKIDLAKNVNVENLIMLEQGRFQVPSEMDSINKKYEVSFGNENVMPSCTCYDWQNSPYLCKHFFAIFKKFPAWS